MASASTCRVRPSPSAPRARISSTRNGESPASAWWTSPRPAAPLRRGVLRARLSQDATIDGGIRQGFLEGSNSNMVEELTSSPRCPAHLPGQPGRPRPPRRDARTRRPAKSASSESNHAYHPRRRGQRHGPQPERPRRGRPQPRQREHRRLQAVPRPPRGLASTSARARRRPPRGCRDSPAISSSSGRRPAHEEPAPLRHRGRRVPSRPGLRRRNRLHALWRA